MKSIIRLFKWIFIFGVSSGFILFTWLVWFAMTPLNLATTPLEFEVRHGANVRSIAVELEHAGVGFDPAQFTLLVRLSGQAGNIKAGSYEMESGITSWQLMNKLVRGDVSQADFLIVEGWNFRQIRAEINADPNLAHDSLKLTDAEIMQRLGEDNVSAEGQFFPETYYFPKGTSDLALLRRAHIIMKNKLSAEWAMRDADLPYISPYQALIMASIIEKETGQAADRLKVASVFVNRLRTAMPLQTDPTIIYGLGEKYNGNIHKRDLISDGAFNTYTRTGLPPTPVAMPGIESLRAAMHPASTDYFYFVSRGDGTSEFSRNLPDHNRAVNKYIKNR